MGRQNALQKRLAKIIHSLCMTNDLALKGKVEQVSLLLQFAHLNMAADNPVRPA